MRISRKTPLVTLLLLALVLVRCRQEPPPTPVPTATVAPTPTDTPAPAAQILTLDEASTPAPNLIGRHPAETAALDGAFELYFDQPMDTQRTAAALQVLDSLGNPIEGQISWPQPRVLRFQPAAKLPLNSNLEAILADSAASEAGTPLTEGLSLAFQTIGQLEIAQVSPAPRSIEVASETAVTVIFNRPVVPLLTYDEQATLPNPLEITPPLEGTGEWVNTSVYVFRPATSWLGRQNYTVRVSAEVINETSATGAQLTDDFAWDFTITAPTINRLSLPNITDYPRDSYRHLRLDQDFRLFFNQPMDRASTEAAISLASSEEQMPLTFTWNEENTTVTFTPTQLLDLGTRYLLSVSDSATSSTGGRLRDGLTWTAVTMLPPNITSTNPRDGATQEEFSSSFTIRFASPMDQDSLAGKVIFDPPTQADPDGQYNQWAWNWRFYGLEPSTTYTVRVLPGLSDPYGNQISEERVFSFTTAPYTPSARWRLNSPLALYRTGGSTALWASYRNVQTLEATLYPLTPLQFHTTTQGFRNPRDFSPPASNAIWQQTINLPTQLNVRDYQRFDLTNTRDGTLSPGFYFATLNSPEVEHPSRHLDARPILYASLNLTLKTTTSEAMIWATDLATGAPVPDVPIIFYDNAFNPIFEGVTDADGLLYRAGLDLDPGYNNRYYAITNSDQHFGAAFNQWTDGTNPYDFGVSTDYYLRPGGRHLYLYTDRPLYRPGATVELKGILRRNDDLAYSLPTLEEVFVTINSYDGTVLEESVPLNEYGTFVLSLPLDDEATLGTYYVDVRAERDSGERLSGGYFDVAEFRKPTFQVDVSAAESDVAIGETIAATVQADFFAGGAVANAAVDYYVRSAPYTFAPSGNLRPYSFDNVETDRGYYYYNPYYDPYGDFLMDGTGQTDGRGRFDVGFPAETSAEGSGSRRLTIEATVTDIASNAISGRVEVIAHQSAIYPGIKSGQRIGIAGDDLTFDLIAVDWAADPVPNTNVAVEIVERRWNSVQEEDERGNTIWRSEVEEIPVASFEQVTLDANGRGSVTFVPESGGVYRAYVRARDAQNREAIASTYAWVSGSEFVPWRRSNDHGFDLIADSDSYQPGDTAEILIASPFQGESYALITLERGHIYQREVIKLESNSTIYRLPITGDMAPNMFVSVMVIKGVDQFNSAPDFKMGLLQFAVERQEQALTIDITADREVLGPRDTVNYTLRVTDHAGRPVEAELSLSLVDLALLSLAERNAPPILDFFYSERWLSVQTAVLLTLNMDAFNEELEDEIKGGGGGGGGRGVITLRENFQDTAYWNGQIRTDANGVATVAVPLPDNLTTWRLDARAVTLDTLVGEATHDIQTTRPLLVNPQTPRFFIQGDRATLGALVRNTTVQALETAVTMQATGVTFEGADTQTITIPASGSAVVTWDVTVDEVERVDLVFSAVSGDYADAARPEIATLEGGGLPVYRYTAPETVGTAGQLLEGGVIVESLGLPILPDFEVTEGELTVEIAPSLSAAMTDGLDYLQHYPHECTEQIVSKFLPNVVTTRALIEAGLRDPDLEADLQNQVNVALQRLYSRQNPDGGWPWWRGSQSVTLVSAYVTLGMLEAQRAGYPVDERALDDGVQYLFEQIGEVERLDGRFKLNRQAFILYTLARADDTLNLGRWLDDLHSQRESLDLYARAWLAQAMRHIDAADPRLDTLTADLISTAALSATGAHWNEAERDYWNWNSDTRSTAIILSHLAQTDPQNPLVANGVRWLMSNRDNGAWQGTQETAWVIMALTDWMVASGELEADYDYEVALNGNLLAQEEANQDNLRTPFQLQTDIADLLTDGLNRLAIGRTDGTGNLYYTAHMQTILPVAEINPVEKGIVISRDYFHPDDRQTPLDTAVQGDTILGRLTLVVPADLHYVVIEDHLPAGLEVIDQSLRTSPQAGTPDPYIAEEGAFNERGWGWWYFDHVELRDEMVVISADYLPAGTYEYVYLARASTVGQFQTIPPEAHEFYFPEVYGRGQGMLFTVTD